MQFDGLIRIASISYIGKSSARWADDVRNVANALFQHRLHMVGSDLNPVQASDGHRSENKFRLAFGEWHENKGNPDDRHAYGKMPGTRSG